MASPFSRQLDSHEDSQGSSGCSTGSTHNLNSAQSKTNPQYEDCSLQMDTEVSYLNDDAACSSMTASPEAILSVSEMPKDEVVSGCAHSEFASPLQTIPPFQSFADGIPSPVFTSSVSYDFSYLTELSNLIYEYLSYIT
ncbi:hypothetical protein BHM03_00056675 [Ensete ventricosum]|nr:hypothetical protein BHM03_00056675 [Ensete ventricosum]